MEGAGAFLKLFLSLQSKTPRGDNGGGDGSTIRVCCKHLSAFYTSSFINLFFFLLPASILEGRRFRESPESPRNLPEIIGQAST